MNSELLLHDKVQTIQVVENCYDNTVSNSNMATGQLLYDTVSNDMMTNNDKR